MLGTHGRPHDEGIPERLRRLPGADNPRIDAYIKHLRSSAGGTMIERRNVLKESMRLLKRNQLIGFLVDQNFAAGGVFVDFFGRLAATTPILSVLARRTGATILHTHNRWVGNSMKIYWGEVPPLSTNPNTDMAIAEDTYVMTKIVEGWIRKNRDNGCGCTTAGNDNPCLARRSTRNKKPSCGVGGI